MSLTSYRAAPPRGKSMRKILISRRRLLRPHRKRFRAFGRPGSDLLSRALRHSTIGAESFHVRVRNGIGCTPLASATRSPKRKEDLKARAGCNLLKLRIKAGSGCRPLHGTNENQADRAISTAKLNASLHLHMRPINVVVYHDSQRDLVLRRVSRLDAFSVYPFTT